MRKRRSSLDLKFTTDVRFAYLTVDDTKSIRKGSHSVNRPRDCIRTPIIRRKSWKSDICVKAAEFGLDRGPLSAICIKANHKNIEVILV